MRESGRRVGGERAPGRAEGGLVGGACVRAAPRLVRAPGNRIGFSRGDGWRAGFRAESRAVGDAGARAIRASFGRQGVDRVRPRFVTFEPRRPAAPRRGGGRCGKLDAAGLVRVVRRVEVEDAFRREEVRHAQPHEVAGPFAREVEGHHLGPYHRVGRRPGLGLETDDEELGRQRARPRLHPRIDPVDVRVDAAVRAGREAREGSFRPAVETEHPQQPIGVEGRRAEHLGETTRADPAIHLHLPQPVLRMDVAEGEDCVLLAPGKNVRDAVPVAHHLHGCAKAGCGPFAVDLGERAAEPQEAAGRCRGGQNEEGDRHPSQPFQYRDQQVRCSMFSILPPGRAGCAPAGRFEGTAQRDAPLP